MQRAMMVTALLQLFVAGQAAAMFDAVPDRTTDFWDGLIAPGMTYEERVDSDQSECEAWLFPTEERVRFARRLAEEVRTVQVDSPRGYGYWVGAGTEVVGRMIAGTARFGVRCMSGGAAWLRVLLLLSLPGMARGLLPFSNDTVLITPS